MGERKAPLASPIPFHLTISMTLPLQRTRVLGTSLSLINILFTVFFIPLWFEYAEAIFGAKTYRLSGNNVALDVVLIIGTIFSFMYCIRHLVKIGKGQEMKLHIPVFIFIAYCIVLIVSLL